MLNELIAIQNRLVDGLSMDFKRYLYGEINWNNRLIILTGGRGTGKTTMVLQHLMETYGSPKKCLYFSADNPLVLKNGIYNTGMEYFKLYGDCLIIDEVHKQENWSVEIKGLYDAYPDKKLIVLGSSTLNILAEKGDLSRRSLVYSLDTMSFREYLTMTYKTDLPSYTLEQILSQHVDISSQLCSQFQTILGDFNDYLMMGSYPFFISYSKDEYFKILANVIDKTIYEDITSLRSLKSFSSVKMKKLLGYLAVSKVPLFNLETLKNQMETSRDTLYEYFDLLARAGLLQIIRVPSKRIKAFKNSKILYKSPNLYFAIAMELWRSDIEKGNIRESFFASQVSKAYPVFSSRDTDFLVVDGDRQIEIEVGGKNKGKKQIAELENGYVFKDGIESGYENSIPLYLAGFLY